VPSSLRNYGQIRAGFYYDGHAAGPVDHAYSKHAEVTVPALDDWEKEWGTNSQRSVQPKLLPVNFRSPLLAIAQSN